MHKVRIDPDWWVTSRLPAFEAMRALGITDRAVAQAMGVSQPTIANWATGKETMPLVRWMALNFVVWRLVEWLGRAIRTTDFEDPRHADRAVAMWQAAGAWAALSRRELKDVVAEPGPELVKRAEELGWKMIDRLGMVEPEDR